MQGALPEDLDLLLALEVFLRERHVSRAAKRLGITQSAASQRLARLREFFADELLTPGRPLASLTPRAEAMAEPLSAALATLRSAIQRGRAFERASSDRHFVLLGNDLLEAAGMPVVLPRLQREAPNVTVQVERVDAQFMSRLERGTADMAFVPEFLVTTSLMRLRPPDEPFVTLMRRGHPASKRPLTLESYLELEHVLITPHGMPGSLVDQALEPIGKHRRVRVRLQHFSAAPFVVANTDLVVTCPRSVLRLGDVFGLKAMKPPVELGADRASLVWHSRMQDDPGHRWLRELIAEMARELNGEGVGALQKL